MMFIFISDLFIGSTKNALLLQLNSSEEEENEVNAFFLPIYWITKCCCKSNLLS